MRNTRTGQAPLYRSSITEGKDPLVKKPLRRLLITLTLATTATTGYLTTDTLNSQPADTGWGAPATTPDTGWGTPPTEDGTGDTPASKKDTGWG
jgi:hypothetical protein